MIVIIDYGMGNLRSIAKAFERLNINTIISSDKKEIDRAEKLILPGVGHFGTGMKNLHELDLINLLYKKIDGDRIPILGICVGLQLLTKSSEEGNVKGLGLIDAHTVKFNFNANHGRLKVPHMGWNLANSKKDNPLLKSQINEELFYFVHSYHIKCDDEKDILFTTVYGYEFISGIWKDNIYGTQFHPEKSYSAGMKLLENFALV